MASFQEIFGNFVFLGLMVLAIISLVFVVQSDNNADQLLSENALVSETFVNVNNTISSLEETSASKFRLFMSEIPVLGFASIVLFTIVDVGRTFGSLTINLFSLIIKIPMIILGVSQTISAVIISFLTLSVIIALWIVYKFGG